MRVPPTPVMPEAAGLWWKSDDWSSSPGDRVAFHMKPVVGFSTSSMASYPLPPQLVSIILKCLADYGIVIPAAGLKFQFDPRDVHRHIGLSL